MARETARVPVAEYVSRVKPALRPTLNAGRKIIQANAPKGTKEIAYRTWPIRYEHDGVVVCGIGDYPRWVAIYFFRGVELADPDGILEGSGKAMRHVKLHEPKEAGSPALRRMLRRAFKVGGTVMPGRTAK